MHETFDRIDPTVPGTLREPDAPAPTPAAVDAPRTPRVHKNRITEEVAELALGAWTPEGVTTALHDDRIVPVEKGIPGERVVATISTLRGRKGWTRATVTDVVEASPERIVPPCVYFREHDCGGCEWQHVQYTAQLDAKREIVRGLLAEVGIVREPDGITALPEPWRYRHSAAIALGRGAGFRKRRRQTVVPVTDCPISHPAISALLATLNEWYDAGVYPDLRGKVWVETKVVGTDTAPRLQLVIGGIGGMDLPARPELHALADALASLPAVVAVTYKHPSGATRAYHGPTSSIVEVGGDPFVLPAGSFFQTNIALVPRLVARIAELTGTTTLDVVADIYCGAGLFTMYLARRAHRVIGIEVDPGATAAAQETARLWGLTNIEFFARPAEKAMDVLPALDLALVDPPRNGLDLRVTDAIIAKRPRQFVYVSCNPITLARDLAFFVAGGYELRWLECFDFFPQTSHVETLAYLTAE